MKVERNIKWMEKKMTINSYLNQLATKAIIRDNEKQSIERSVKNIISKLRQYFGSDISQVTIFGSYSRNTILPRTMDYNSDVDIMIKFNDATYQPQTYLNKLRKFASFYYSSSEINQSNPTIVLSLNHIKFELVPAIQHLLNGLQIPAKASDYQNWISTNPNEFNGKLTTANQNNQNLIKPLVRLLKYWNAKNNYPFASYELEQKIVELNSSYFNSLLIKDIKSLFFDTLSKLSSVYYSTQWQKDKFERASKLIDEIKLYEALRQESLAISSLKKLLPES